MSIRDHVWKLHTDPFYPDIDASGNAISRKVMEKELCPHLDDRVLRLYFDVYDWGKSNIGTLKEQPPMASFPLPRHLSSDGLMMLISGPKESGRDSIANLILHKIAETTGSGKLVVADLRLDGYDKTANVAAVISRIINKVRSTADDGKRIADSMRDAYDSVLQQNLQQGVVSYAGLFESFADELRGTDVTLVVLIKDGADYSSWACIHDTIKSCCSYVIVMTARGEQAQMCHRTMISNSLHVTWIQTRTLDQEMAVAYVRDRIQSERDDAAGTLAHDSLFPFTREAIVALYEPGSTAQQGASLEKTISELRRTCSFAFLAMLKRFGANQIGSPAATTIGAAEMAAARASMNRGARP